MRIQNIYDDVSVRVGLFVGKMIPILTTYLGNGVNVSEIKEMALGGNMKYG
jgi:hypothetical protein